MTSPAPDALRTQLAEDRARIAEALNKAGYGPVFADAPFVGAIAPLLARARAEGEAGALREFESWAQQHADDRDQHYSAIAVGERSGLLMTVMHAREQCAALSAPTTTEGDPT